MLCSTAFRTLSRSCTSGSFFVVTLYRISTMFYQNDTGFPDTPKYPVRSAGVIWCIVYSITHTHTQTKREACETSIPRGCGWVGAIQAAPSLYLHASESARKNPLARPEHYPNNIVQSIPPSAPHSGHCTVLRPEPSPCASQAQDSEAARAYLPGIPGSDFAAPVGLYKRP